MATDIPDEHALRLVVPGESNADSAARIEGRALADMVGYGDRAALERRLRVLPEIGSSGRRLRPDTPNARKPCDGRP